MAGETKRRGWDDVQPFVNETPPASFGKALFGGGEGNNSSNDKISGSLLILYTSGAALESGGWCNYWGRPVII